MKKWYALLSFVVLLAIGVFQQPVIGAIRYHYQLADTIKYASPNTAIKESGWYKVQLHGHTIDSAAVLTPKDYINCYKQLGYDAVAITNHSSKKQTLTIPNNPSLLFIAGSQEMLGSIELNNLFATKVESQKVTDNPQAVIDRINADGGLSVITHPTDGADIESLHGFKFIEIYNPLIPESFNNQYWDYLLSKGDLVWGMAVDDFHFAGYKGAEMNMGYVMVHADSLSLEAIKKALLVGDFYSCLDLYGGMTLETSVTKGIITARVNKAGVFTWIGLYGQILQVTRDVTSDTYRIKGDEKYVRLRVMQSGKLEGDTVWSQPLVWKW